VGSGQWAVDSGLGRYIGANAGNRVRQDISEIWNLESGIWNLESVIRLPRLLRLKYARGKAMILFLWTIYRTERTACKRV
jgi:hypothetical protein